MWGRVSSFGLLGMGVGLGWLGALQLFAVFFSPPGGASVAALGSLIAFIPAAVFTHLGARSLLQPLFGARDDVYGVDIIPDEPPYKAEVIPFPRRR